jgi:hemerythrin
MQRRHEAGEEVAGLLLALLERWLVQHILAEDVAYTGQVNTWIDRIGREGLGEWINDNLRRHFRHP